MAGTTRSIVPGALLDLIVVRIDGDPYFRVVKCRWIPVPTEGSFCVDKKGLKKLLRKIKRMRRESENTPVE